MILLEIQENLIKCELALKELEEGGASVYLLYKKLFKGGAHFEAELVAVRNKLIEIGSQVVAATESIIRKTKDRDLILLIESGYFKAITDSMSGGLLKVVTAPSFSIPETTSKIILGSKEIEKDIAIVIDLLKTYNKQVSDLRRKRSYMLTLYKLPKMKDLPSVIVRPVGLSTLLDIKSLEYIKTPPLEKPSRAKTEPELSDKEKPKTKLRGKLIKKEKPK